MMPITKLSRIAVANALRSPRHFVLSAFGIVIGIASFVFFLGLSLGVRNVILGQIFPIEEVKVVAPRAAFLGADLTKRIDDAIVAKIRARPEVAIAVPRMNLSFPASGRGWFDGKEMNFEVGGFCDGINADYVAGEDFAELFQDWESPENQAKQVACGPAPDHACPQPDRYWCDKRDMKCHHRVPVIVSNTLLELYNGQFAKSHGLPVIGSFEQFVVERGGLGKMRFNMRLGDTMLAGTNQNIPAHKQRSVQAVVVGINNKAMNIGMTVPIGYVERWNRAYDGEEAASAYSSVVVGLRDKDDVAPFSAWIQQELDLRLDDSMGERFATAIFIITVLFLLISLIIVTISAINIAHNFFMQVSERRREIGVLRAVGATRADVRVLILGEAALIGVIGGTLGVLAAIGAGWMWDVAAATLLPPFPFKPVTYFDFRPWIVGSGLLFAILFCVIGGFLPARKASLMEPAQALAQQ